MTATSLPIRRLAPRSGWAGSMSWLASRVALNLDTGDDYDVDELKEEAWRIMVAERKARSSIPDSHV